MTTILNGLLGGLLIGVVAAVVTRFVADDPSASAVVLEGTLGAGTLPSRWRGFVIRILYGGLAGGLLVALELFVLELLAVPPTTVEAFGVAVAWSALLFGVLSVGRQVASPRSITRSHLGASLAYHLVYGLGLGLWLRMTWIT